MPDNGKITELIKGAGEYTAGQLGPTLGPKRIAEEVFEGAPLLTGLANITGKAGMAVASSPFKAMGAVGSALFSGGGDKPATEEGLDDVKDAVKQQTKEQKDEYKKQDEHRTLLQKIFRTGSTSSKKENRFAKEEGRREAKQLSLPGFGLSATQEQGEQQTGFSIANILGSLSGLFGPITKLATVAGTLLTVVGLLRSLLEGDSDEPTDASKNQDMAVGAVVGGGQALTKTAKVVEGALKPAAERAPRATSVRRLVADAPKTAAKAAVRAAVETTPTVVKRVVETISGPKPEQSLRAMLDNAPGPDDINARRMNTLNLTGTLKQAGNILKLGGVGLEAGFAAYDIYQDHLLANPSDGTPAGISQEEMEKRFQVRTAEAFGTLAGAWGGAALGAIPWVAALTGGLSIPGGAAAGAVGGGTVAGLTAEMFIGEVRQLPPEEQKKYDIFEANKIQGQLTAVQQQAKELETTLKNSPPAMGRIEIDNQTLDRSRLNSLREEEKSLKEKLKKLLPPTSQPPQPLVKPNQLQGPPQKPIPNMAPQASSTDPFQTQLLSAMIEMASNMGTAASDLKAASVNMADRSITVNGPGALAQVPPGPRKTMWN